MDKEGLCSYFVIKLLSFSAADEILFILRLDKEMINE